jgi:hypothetical protein
MFSFACGEKNQKSSFSAQNSAQNSKITSKSQLSIFVAGMPISYKKTPSNIVFEDFFKRKQRYFKLFLKKTLEKRTYNFRSIAGKNAIFSTKLPQNHSSQFLPENNKNVQKNTFPPLSFSIYFRAYKIHRWLAVNTLVFDFIAYTNRIKAVIK